MGLYEDSVAAAATGTTDSASAATSVTASSAVPTGPPPADQNDEVCAELRALHAKLREKNSALNAMRARLLPPTQARAAEMRAMRKEREPLEIDEVCACCCV